MLGDGGLGDTEAGGRITHRRGAGGKPLDYPASDRVRQRTERIVNH
jgi:hypothetical protein